MKCEWEQDRLLLPYWNGIPNLRERGQKAVAEAGK